MAVLTPGMVGAHTQGFAQFSIRHGGLPPASPPHLPPPSAENHCFEVILSGTKKRFVIVSQAQMNPTLIETATQVAIGVLPPFLRAF